MEAEPLARISSPILQSGAQGVADSWQDEDNKKAMVDLLVALAHAVDLQSKGIDPAIDNKASSLLGRHLLELLRKHLVRGWSGHSSSAVAVLQMLQACEQVRDTIEPEWTRDFWSLLAAPSGLSLLVEVAHDLRSPLTSILFLAETLQRGQTGEVNEVQRRQLGIIYGAALSLSALASNVIELARGGDEVVDKEPSPFSVAEMFGTVKDMVHPIAVEKGLTVRLLPPSHGPPPHADHRLGHPLTLSRVLLNLTTNALKFTDEGFVEILAQPKGLTRLEFAVRDTGKGINWEAFNHLYEAFRRTSHGSGYHFSGTGLGLAICRKLVKAMGSKLCVETRPQWGTRFYFELDLPPAAPLGP